MFGGRAVPLFGALDCHGDPGCSFGPHGNRGGPPRPVWLVLYPDCTDATGDFGWVLVDGVDPVKGVSAGYEASTPCHP